MLPCALALVLACSSAEKAGETGDDPVDDAAAFFPDTEGFPPPPPIPQEIPGFCGNLLDDDGDGAVDCEDPDCASAENCLPDGCTNGEDDNGDGTTDCEDPDCENEPSCAPEDCTNGEDDNGDGASDCDDPQCADALACTPEDCANELDDNADGLVDCEDPQCSDATPCAPEDCANGSDDNGDGLDDCEDPQCADAPSCQDEDCANGVDDDGDGDDDCDDSDCAAALICQPEDCANGGDDNGDGLADCADPDCGGVPPCAEIACDDANDGDGDGLIDCADPDCADAPTCGEDSCVDGIDNDGDGSLDCLDSECFDIPECIESECEDGEDDDNDGLADCADPDCFDAAPCLPTTCLDYYLCLGVEGCGCVLGEDCPPVDSAEFGACQSNCVINAECNQSCVDVLDFFTAVSLSLYEDCAYGNCVDVPDDQTTDCVFTNCLSEYAKCFYAGTETCASYGYECGPACAECVLPDCNPVLCIQDCLDALSAEAFKDAFAWDSCRYPLCDADNDFEEDSAICLSIAGNFACAEFAESCHPATPAEAPLSSCADTRACILACPLEDTACLDTCIPAMAPESLGSISALFQCVIGACGTTEAELSPICIKNSLTGACAGANANCGP